MASIKITSEDEAFELLAKLVEGFQFDEITKVEFEEWPRFVIQIKGIDFDGTLPTRIMPTLLELQKEVYRIYCRTVYDEGSTRKLTKSDREKLELLIRVDKGSSVFETILSEAISKVFLDSVAKMSPEQLTASLIVFGISVTSIIAWKSWLNYRIKEKVLDQSIQLSQLENQRLELFHRAKEKFPEAQVSSEGMDNVRNELLKKMKRRDSLTIDTGTPRQPYPDPIELSGDQASQITHRSREKSVERIVEGEFFLRSANFTHAKGIRIEVEQMDSGYSFQADIPLGVLGDEQMEALKNNSWNKENIAMTFLVKELRQTYTSAKVISVKNLVSGR